MNYLDLLKPPYEQPVPMDLSHLKEGERVSGWIPYSSDVIQGWSGLDRHGDYECPPFGHDTFMSSGGQGVMYATQAEAWQVFRHRKGEEFAAELERIDRWVEAEK